MERLTTMLLDCGAKDIEVLKNLDNGVLAEAVAEIREKGLSLNFPNLYFLAVEKGINLAGIPEDKAEIDVNYSCASIYVSSGVPNTQIRELEGYGFKVVYY